ncbi:Citrate synthase 2 [Anatilimnocola aggregata]|uniref:Citrate synthase n=1 Tax=Anatilimnocola aggregata TaxID=2528021 RepID=A0A517YJC3_9BACT|nr:citrate/2-methylcitrate synthase [Anatilimnocola aggregata]QDU30305.1 Citrate synthase 2 [Anatilimnocola aggregata]
MTESYSPGLEGIVAGETAVSTVETGLTYRGYTIEELGEKSNYEEVAYLVLHGELPTAAQAASFRQRLTEAAHVPPEVIDTLRSIPKSASTMDVLRSAASLLAHWEPEVNDNSHDANVRKSERLIAKMPIIVAARQRLKDGQQVIAADQGLSLPANFLWMLRGEKPSERQVKALDVSFILYAEHEFNASAFSARCVVSTLSDLHSGITAAIGALKGPLHGGANERAMEVLQEVSSPAEAEAWIRKALAEKRRIMGFGHRVYKDGDPRAVYLKTLTTAVAKETGHDDLEQTAEIIETIVRTEKKLPPNVDWPCARLYHYLGLPIDLYTPLFVVARIVGWSAHIIEQLDNNRLIRPRAIYTGLAERKWQPLAARG